MFRLEKDSLPFPFERSSLADQILSIIQEQSRKKPFPGIRTFGFSHSSEEDMTSHRLTASRCVYQPDCIVPNKPEVLRRLDSSVCSIHPVE